MGDKTPLVDPDRLRTWLDASGIEPGSSLAVMRITTGHSNEVFLVERGDRTFVLRRPPRTPLSPTAHDMAREHRLLTAFTDNGAAVPVPKPVALCTDVDVIGAPFYLMERLEGIVVRDALPDAFAADDRRRAAFAESLVDLLAATHAFDWRAGGLDGFGKPDGYLDRQVPRWLGHQSASRRTKLAGNGPKDRSRPHQRNHNDNKRRRDQQHPTSSCQIKRPWRLIREHIVARENCQRSRVRARSGRLIRI